MYVHVQSKQCHKDMRIRTKPLRDSLRASKDKNRGTLDGCPCRWPTLKKATRGNYQGQERLVPSRFHHSSRT